MNNAASNPRKRKRGLKSIYFDRETKQVAKASAMPSRPNCRPRRYLYLGQWYFTPSETNKTVIALLLQHNIKIKKQKLPF